ncbi:hypothetical protein HGB07_07685 [Candidatus Roizmanbacteria bacterium]|nr:hypothetical protein [Candidatus Roizmanbacteria bacterium]
MSNNYQRLNNWWEVIYNPRCEEFAEVKKDDECPSVRVWHKLSVDIEVFACKKNKYTNSYYGKIFDCVNFFGELRGEKRIKFNDCEFKKVSFAGSVFCGVLFRRCLFDETSFSLSTFNDCEFRDCYFKQISASGNKTIFRNTYIESEKFLSDMYLNTDKELIERKGSSFSLQRSEWYKTKSVLARQIMQMPPVGNDINVLISCVEMARCLEVKYDMYRTVYEICDDSGGCKKKLLLVAELLFSLIEYLVINIFGWLTGWGYKIGKVVVIGGFMFLLFAIIYNNYIYIDDGILRNVLRSFEYGLLFGYTKYDYKCFSEIALWLHFLNSLAGMFWFSALIPVIINKMSNDDR